MDTRLNFLLKDVLVDCVAPSNAAIEELRSKVNFEFPGGYWHFINQCSGAEGEVGENNWISFFAVKDLIIVNKDYGLLMNEIPDYFLFAKDAADTGYAFHKSLQTFHSFGLMSNFNTDPIKFCGNSFIEFIEQLYN